MHISIFDLFSIGIGPSSSHTVGPMKAAYEFVKALKDQHDLHNVTRVQVEIYGSLAFTGQGHGTDRAILLGLEGHLPKTIDPDLIPKRAAQIKETKSLNLFKQHSIVFDMQADFIFNYKDLLPKHTNGMRFSAYNQQKKLTELTYYSIGGGFIIDEHSIPAVNLSVPYPFSSSKELLSHCEQQKMSIKDIMFANECSIRTESEVRTGLQDIVHAMRQCIDKGCQTTGILPGGLNVQRRAANLWQILNKNKKPSFEHLDSLNWLNMYAIAVNEENAAGSRVVTAPTNGASGVIPAVLHYYLDFYPDAKNEDALHFLLTAGAFAILYKKGASISGAEVGCQGEVGVACSMAAAALTYVLGGNLYQIENAAEIAMEHHLGLTCDPIGGLVQIPCIERNAMGAIKALNATRLALLGTGQHYVSLDKVIQTMKQTGKDMMTIYKETSLGGLAANFPEC